MFTLHKIGLACLTGLVLLRGVPASAQSGTLTTLYSFGAIPDGDIPKAPLIQGSDGNFYGTTAYGGGANNTGTVFRLTPDGQETILHSFQGYPSDGGAPRAGLLQASDGNFYGTTYGGGANNTGTIFKFTPGGTLTILYSFSALDPQGYNTDGAAPYSALIEGKDGNLYGTTEAGGSYRAGTIFQITLAGNFTVFHSLGANDGAGPIGALVLGSDGNFYGTTANGTFTGDGTFFRLKPDGTMTTLYFFNTQDGVTGSHPWGTLIQASDGNFYGTTVQGGANGYGTVFKITPSGSESTIYTFNSTSGGTSYAGLILDPDGNFYGTTSLYGAGNYGTVFQLTPAGTFTVLYTFDNGANGGGPVASLIYAKDGNFYGTTSTGGANVSYGGTVFRLSVGSPTPVLGSISPGSRDAGGPGFTLVVKGSNFASGNVVEWTAGGNTTALTTTYVSATELTATVPASLIANTGTAQVSVVNSGGSASGSKKFTILLTTLKLTSAGVTKNSNGPYSVTLSLKNIGYKTASSTQITKATLGAAATTTTLPVSMGSLNTGASGNATLTYPVSAGASGSTVTLKVSATFTGGSFSGSLKVTLP